MSEKFVENGDISLWVEDFGDASNQTVLLIRGIGGSGVAWNVSFCEILAASGYHVIRYDQRDSGLSSFVNYRRNPYRLADLAKDAICILDSYGVKKAHIVGMSMGGFISQLLTIQFPHRIKTLTLLSTTLDFRPQLLAGLGIGTAWLRLPGPKRKTVRDLKSIRNLKALKVIKSIASRPTPIDPVGYESREARQYVEIAKVCNGEKTPFDPAEYAELRNAIYEHRSSHGKLTATSNFINHGRAIRKGPIHIHSERIRRPTMVIHGSRDPIIPVKHARALARIIPNAKRIIIYGMGHVISKHYFDDIITGALLHFWGDPFSAEFTLNYDKKKETRISHFLHKLPRKFWHKRQVKVE
ncbi:MAG: alpha/beta hydrolase [Alphaproteobacteria bacterium]|nr:alpha/beta hydrolase [Alphaproteobacteria bacterium]